MMLGDDDDGDLLHAWRDAPQAMPGELLDRRVLQAAEAQRRRRRGVPLAAAMAACLVLGFYALRTPLTHEPAPAAVIDTSSFGLYEGREFSALADPATTVQPHAAPVNTGFSPP